MEIKDIGIWAGFIIPPDFMIAYLLKYISSANQNIYSILFASILALALFSWVIYAMVQTL